MKGTPPMPGKHANNWDNRYDHDRYFYGVDPNYLVARELPGLPPGRGLFLAEGEGRNAVFAAGLGHEVTAVDSSQVGMLKAQHLAEARGVRIRYRDEDVVTGDWDRDEWDFVVMCFAHLPPEEMPQVHARIARSLRPGGRLIHVSFSKAQLGRPSGGPPRLGWLHALPDLKDQYAGLDLAVAEEKEVVLDEGPGHRGAALVIEIVGTRPE